MSEPAPWSVCDWGFPACVTPCFQWPFNTDGQHYPKNPVLGTLILGGQRQGLGAALLARNSCTSIALPRVVIKHRQKLRIYAAARGWQVQKPLCLQQEGWGALSSLAWRWKAPSVILTLLGFGQECTDCVSNRNEQRIRQLESTASAQGGGAGLRWPLDQLRKLISWYVFTLGVENTPDTGLPFVPGGR